MKIAIVHDHFLEFGGAERVAVAIKRVLPEAVVHTAAYNKQLLADRVSGSASWKIRSSWAMRIPFFHKLYSPLRFLAPWIWESFDFSGYDVVISSSGWFMSKGIVTQDGTQHISYIHHQPRYLYYYETAVEWQKYWPVRIYAYIINHFLRTWDFIGSQRPDILVANSEETRRRIQKFYRRDAVVIYPPVYIPEDVSIELRKPHYYVTLSRFARAKNIDLLILTANKLKIPLKIVGSGRDEAYLKSLAGPTVEFLGRLKDKEFVDLYRGAKAFLNAGIDEEFGIAPVEAMGHGVPVIAYASGGLTETVTDGKNGYLFTELTRDSLSKAINKFEKLTKKEHREMSAAARKESQKYTSAVFKDKLLALIRSV
ncbi:MAG: GDP-mannose-dependent alpha-mannosyltransferase [Microgenomates bacterium OLB23]|nr:MAG: GDP-mannose-dependent alpha-mannosyltransferase [Microgenomates bacterium OLB23]